MKITILTLIIISFIHFSCSAQIITTIAGTGTGGNTGDGGPAILAGLGEADAVATDNYGNIYISSIQGGNSRVRKIDAAGIITTIAGNGTAGFSGDGGPSTNAQIYAPQGIAVDDVGNVYFADARNYRIRKIDTSGIITTIAGTGTNVNSGDGGTALVASIGQPSYIAIDGSGNIFFSSTNVVRKINSSGIITTVAGTGITGYSGDGGPATTAQIGTLGIALDAIGNIFITGDNVVRKIDTFGIITTVAGNGTSGYSGDGGMATNAQVSSLIGVTVDSYGDFFIVELWNFRVRMVNSTGIITTFAGGGTCAPYDAGDGRQATDACLARPRDVKVDNAGNLFIADGDNFRIRKIAGVTSVGTFVNKNNSIIVHPNPSLGAFAVSVSSTTDEPVHLSITDVTGRVVKEIYCVANKSIDVSLNESAGIYILSAVTAHGKWTRKIAVEP